MQIGVEDGPEQYVFGNILYLDVDQRGSVFVLDYLAQKIRVYEPDGRYSYSVGGKGQGPGEFLRARGFAMDSTGSLWVSDAGNDRISRFDATGTFEMSCSRVRSGVTVPWFGGILPSGELLEFGFARPEARSGMDQGSLMEFRPVVYHLDGNGVDSLPALSYRGEMVGRVPLPFSGKLKIALDPSGYIWSGMSNGNEIVRKTLRGVSVLTLTLPEYDPVPVSDSEAVELIREYNGFGYPLDRNDFPPFEPTIARISIADDGKVLVFPREKGYEVGSQFDLFASDGSFIARVTLPVTFLITPSPVMRNGSLFGVVLGAFDVPLVVRVDFGGVPEAEMPGSSTGF